MGVLDQLDEPLAVDCPRCGRSSEQAFYGPCDGCRAELRARFQGVTTEAVDVAYEPKMNVTPNAVALKDD